MKLRCKQHSERAMVLPRGSVIHRLTGEKCDSKFLKTNGGQYTPQEVIVNAYIASNLERR